MVQRLPGSPYVVDPADPRAPSQEEWDAMTPEERDRVVAMLPAEVPMEVLPPEGDEHWNAKVLARQTLDAFFRRIGRKIYVSSELAVFYPGERRFAPDVLAVLDVEHRQRKKWVVAKEGKGLDFVLEVHVEGDRDKDFKLNVERYARLGIAEYFIFDRGELSLRGYRLPSGEPGKKKRVYKPIVPQQGRFASHVLGIELMVDGDKLRFLYGAASIPEADELIAKLGSMVDDLLVRRQEADAARAAEARRADAAEAARATEAKARAELERKLAEALAEIERLKRGR